MILSELRMDWQRARQPYEWHRTLWQLFPDQPPELRSRADDPRSGFLFRMHRLETGRDANVMLLSPIPPTRAATGVEVLRTRGYSPTLKRGDTLHFLLTANPIKTIADEDGRINAKGTPKKCRVPLLREEDLRAWLSRKLDGAVSLGQLEVRTEAPLYFRKAGGAPGKIAPATFEGRLRVDAPDRFLQTLYHGIGPAKAFGCGLLLVRRA
jgi:CRISPR system Cascade subunit CasE